MTITQIRMGTSDNIIAETALLRGTVRSLSREARVLGRARMAEICAGAAQMSGAQVTLEYEDDVPVTHNDPAQTRVAAATAARLVGEAAVDADCAPNLGAEDFSYMLDARPGAFVWIGNGDTAAVHNPGYDFNDAAIPYGAAFFATLVEREMPLP